MGIPPSEVRSLALHTCECQGWHSSTGSAKRLGAAQDLHWMASVLVGPGGAQPVVDLRRPVGDLREAHHGYRVLHRDLAAVDLLEEVHHLVEAAELGIVVLDVSRRELLRLLYLDRVDHCLEDPLAGRVLEADGDQHQLALAVLLALVAESYRGGLAGALQLVDEDR